MAAVALLAVWTIYPRFALSKPSLIDDWFGILYSPRAAHDLLHAHYDSRTVDFNGRFRPAYLLWQYVVWHVGSSGRSLLVPTLWLVAGRLLFIAAVGVAAAYAASQRVSRTWAISIGSLVAACVALTPALAVVSATFSSEQPIAVGALTIGGLVCATKIPGLVHAPSGNRRLLIAVAVALGYLLYLFGVYLWEASAALVVIVPALYTRLNRDLAGSRFNHSVLAATMVAITAPLMHQAANLGRAGATMSDHSEESKEGFFAFALGTVARTIEHTLAGMWNATGTPLWLLAFVLVSLLWVRSLRDRERDHLLWAGVVSAGVLCTLIQGVASANGFGESPGRYFVPWVAAIAIVSGWHLAELKPRARIQVMSLALACFLLLGVSRSEIENWLQSERAGAAAIDLAAAVSRGHCDLYLSNFSHRIGLPRLLQYSSSKPYRDCESRGRFAYTENWDSAGKARFPAQCHSRWRLAIREQGISLFECSYFVAASALLDQDHEPVDPHVDLVRFTVPHALVPATSLITIGAP